MTTATQAITGVDFVCIPTSDHDRAVDFYENTLGLERGKQWGSRPSTEFQAGNLTIALFDPSGFGQGAARPNSAPIAFQVDDVEAMREQLKAKGVTFVAEEIDSGVCLQAIFLDPDNNPLIIHHRYSPDGA
jgi:catechol 2,3-dioxygenase-like lactoylglutathione lyase family enzyme